MVEVAAGAVAVLVSPTLGLPVPLEFRVPLELPVPLEPPVPAPPALGAALPPPAVAEPPFSPACPPPPAAVALEFTAPLTIALDAGLVVDAPIVGEVVVVADD